MSFFIALLYIYFFVKNKRWQQNIFLVKVIFHILLPVQVVNWIDVFSRELYKEILLESLKFCVEKKSLRLH